MTVLEPGVAPDADAAACSWGNSIDTRGGGRVIASDVEGAVCEVKCCRSCVTSSYILDQLEFNSTSQRVC